MFNPHKSGTTAVVFLFSLCISFALIVLLSARENILLRTGGTALVLLIHSGVLYAAGRGITISGRKRDEVQEETENGTVGVLIPVEDESDLGELLEVEEGEPAFELPVKEEETVQQPQYSDKKNDEPLEELESCEESVEELESVDE